eukprot:TRINITY_DN4442_c0_g2_i1.p1 TRINITY_DN4442_c0_g2~~TRINITY_DN4442_c0_g2_i1.p1  ORF type:complete len:906 (+),score=91.96 TRINITY_DN4442_c0_g2_i1:49-2766(+)
MLLSLEQCCLLVVAVVARALAANSALPYDLIMPQLRTKDPQERRGSILGDVSKSHCWIGAFTEEMCCRQNNPDCWDEHLNMDECCPNADCWEGDYTYETCCSGKPGVGNAECWGDVYNYARCCALSEPSTTWVDNLFNSQSTEAFYSFDEFYNDAQYGTDFGYYSTGRVMGAGKAAPDANEFAHFTTFPMALSPHFGRVMMRSVFLMWQEREDANKREGVPTDEIFQVVEMGAGSGQLGQDIRDCVLQNCLGLPASVNERWQKVFRYTILERSPALASRQRERGLEVIVSDAQVADSCDVLKSKAVRDNFAADVVISNELVDAFAPVKLKLSVFDLDNIDPGECTSWTEMKLLHLIKVQDVMGLFAQHLGIRNPSLVVKQLRAFTNEFFCSAAETSVGKAAMSILPANTTCLAMVLGLSEIMEMTKLQIPAASNNVRLRLRKDHIVQQTLRRRVLDVQKQLNGYLAIPRKIYQELRNALKEHSAHNNLDITFLIATKTKRLSVPITADRCHNHGIGAFLKRHAARARRLARFYHDLGYPSIYVLMRPGEEEFLRLTDCLLAKDKVGHVLTIDYGASFEPLSHSLSVDSNYDGIFVPPIPHHLMEELPHCHGDWTVCAGRIDWTTFVDFTNLAAVGNELGYETLFYGPQCFLEQMTMSPSSSKEVDGSIGTVSGYSIIENVGWIERHTTNWYGPEKGEPWEQRWTGFKALLQRVPPADARTGKRKRGAHEHSDPLTKSIEPLDAKQYAVVRAPTWHLDTTEIDPCWLYDPTMMPIADWIKINAVSTNSTAREVLTTLTAEVDRALGERFASGYEEAQLSVRLVDFVVKSVGCLSLSNPDSVSSKWRSWYKERWTDVWKGDVLDKVGPAVMDIIRSEARALAANTTQTSRHYPFECMARQTFRILCA